MTLQLRPTFSESWYRVAPLRAKLYANLTAAFDGRADGLTQLLLDDMTLPQLGARELVEALGP